MALSLQATQMRSFGVRSARPSQALQIMIVSTTLFLAAGRFGLAPTSNLHTKAGVKLYDEKDSGVASSDPSGYNIVDVLVGGSQGHVVGIGAILGLRAIGAL